MKYIKTVANQQWLIEDRTTAKECLEKYVLNRPDIMKAIENRDLKTLQVFIEEEFCKTSILQWTEKTIFSRDDLGKILEEDAETSGYSAKIARKIIAYIALHKNVQISTLFGFLRNACSEEELKETLYALILDGYVKEVRTKTGKLLNNLILPDSIKLTDEDTEYLDLFQSVPPSICKPKKSYITKKGKVRGGYQILKTPVFSKKAPGTTELDLKWLDMQNQNRYVLSYFVWDNYLWNHPILPDTPVREEDDDDASWNAAVELFNKNLIAAYIKHYRKTLLIELYRRFGVRELYIMNFFDTRLRNYARGWVITTQGQDVDKALLKFSKEELTPEGMVWLMISIASSHNEKCGEDNRSLDKQTFKEEYEWTKKKIVPLTKLNHKKFCIAIAALADSAESPAVFWAQAEEFWHVMNDLRHGRVPKTGVICHADSTNSGYQLASLFTNDLKIMLMTNVIPNKSGKCKDFYTEQTQIMSRIGLKSKYDRTTWKEIYIPYGYGSLKVIFEKLSKEDVPIFLKEMSKYPSMALNKLLRDVYDEDWTEYGFMLPDGCSSYKQVMAKVEVETEFRGIPVQYVYKVNKAKEEGSVELKANTIHAADALAAREIARRMNFNHKIFDFIDWLYRHPEKWTREENKSRKLMQLLINLGKKFNYYSVRILNEITPDNIDLVPKEIIEKFRKELPKTRCQVSEIHDSFGVNANYGFELMKQYRYILHDLYMSDYLMEVVWQLTEKYDLNFDHEKDPIIAEAILEGKYALK